MRAAAAFVVLAACTSGGTSGTSASSGSNGTSGAGGSGKPKGYTPCYERYFKPYLSQCTGSDKCGGVLDCEAQGTAGTPRCRPIECSSASQCTERYDSVCEHDPGDEFHFECVAPNSLAPSECRLMNGAGTGTGTSGGTCTEPPKFNCGTSAAGTLPCPANQVCCLAPGCDTAAADPYTANGAVSACEAPGAASGDNGRCPSPKIQLCATSSDCGPGYACDPAKFFCKPDGP